MCHPSIVPMTPNLQNIPLILRQRAKYFLADNFSRRWLATIRQVAFWKVEQRHDHTAQCSPFGPFCRARKRNCLRWCLLACLCLNRSRPTNGIFNFSIRSCSSRTNNQKSFPVWYRTTKTVFLYIDNILTDSERFLQFNLQLLAKFSEPTATISPPPPSHLSLM